jgi:regulator of sirC expression with transglutaminase-like and TPR domain
LLDTISEGERALDLARRAVEQSDPARAERELSRFLTEARPVLERAGDLPVEYVDLLGRTAARALVARAAAWVEQAFAGKSLASERFAGERSKSEPAGAALREAARADVAEANDLPAEWLDGTTQMMLGRLQRVLELSPA